MVHSSAADAGTHRWQFFRAGDFQQVSLTSGADLLALDQLDQKLWAALACPVRGLHFDARTLELIDADHDGRIRASELIGAIKWAGTLLKDPNELMAPHEALPLAAINEATDDGAAMLASARHVHELLGRGQSDTISIADTTEALARFAQLPFNGDGVITADSSDDEELKAVIADIIGALGSDTDLSGKPGISRDTLERFVGEAARLCELSERPGLDPSLMPLGDGTAAAAAAIAAVRVKIVDYFTRCRLAAFDPRAGDVLNRDENEFLTLAEGDIGPTTAGIGAFPLAHVEGGRPLPLHDGINPAWEGAVATFYSAAVVPLLGERSELRPEEWRDIEAKLAPYDAWHSAVASTAVNALPIERLREILASDAATRLGELLDRDLAEAGTADAISAADRLVRYCRHLLLLCENFVNFNHFYSGGESAIFQAGRLYIDQRSCDLTLEVDDAARQSTMVALAGTYLLYCDCVRKASGEKRQIAAAVTNGDSDNLMVGRNGIFYDREGRDWDATITKIVDNPISLRQAFWSPYKKLVRLIDEQVAKRAAAAEAASSSQTESAATGVASADKAKPPEGRKIDVGTVAALGVAFGAIATAVAAFAGYGSGLIRLPFWQLCVALAVLLVIISGPSLLIAWLKLRKRNLGPILDANGWAVNAKARLNVPFGASLTGVAHLPPDARIATGDRFGQRPAAWPKLLLIVVVISFFYSLLNSFGWIDRLTGGAFGDPAGTQPDLEIRLTPEAPAEAPEDPAQ
jgi:hypothetical protein